MISILDGSKIEAAETEDFEPNSFVFVDKRRIVAMYKDKIEVRSDKLELIHCFAMKTKKAEPLISSNGNLSIATMYSSLLKLDQKEDELQFMSFVTGEEQVREFRLKGDITVTTVSFDEET